MQNRIYHVISNTHWDREWRFPYQRNRQMLVDMIDKVLEILESEPRYRAFHLDSQSIVIKDYLEVRPHKKEKITEFVKQKRLLIGPWHILPEEFQVGGENLVRNLLLGHRICRETGGVSKIGYSPFSWGQISQLPQIYREFGIELIMFYRGINSLDSPKSEFLWVGADGTEAVSSRFSTMPRYNFYFYIYRPVIHNEDFGDIEQDWKKGGVSFHFADENLSDEDYFIIEPHNNYYPENIAPGVEKIIKDQADDFTTEHVIWMEGHDSSGPNAKTVRILEDIKEKFPGLDVRHSTLEEYAGAVFKSVDKDKLKKVYGERRSAQYDNRSGNLYGYTTSARMYLKQKNFEAERRLQFYAEPFNIFSALAGRDIDDRYPEIAWEKIIENSAHDSIGGCSLDEIHEDMMNRYKQAIEISKGVFERSVKHIANRIDTSEIGKEGPEKDIFLLAVNPNNYTRNEVVKAVIDIPKGSDKKSFMIKDKDGMEYAVQLAGKFPFRPVVEQMINRPMYFEMERYTAYIELKNIPPFGYKTFGIEPADKNSGDDPKIVTAETHTLENNFLKVTINENGTYNVTDKITGELYGNLGYFYDEREAGHAWINVPEAPFVTTLGNKAKIEVIENGPLYGEVKIVNSLEIYKSLPDRKAGNGNLTTITLTTTLSLSRTDKYTGIEIDTENRAESHRLRVMFPSWPEVSSSYGEGQFDVVKRDVKRPDTSGWVEQPMYDYPMHNFVEVSDGEKSFAVLVDGLKEYEVLDDKDKTLAVTLFRAFEYTIQPSSKEDYSYQKGSQCLGRQSYRLAFYPHKGDWQKGNVYEEAYNFNNKISLAQMGKTTGSLKPENSFLQIEPKDLVFSSLKKAEDNSGDFVLRLFNPTDKTIEGEISSLFGIENVTAVTLEEKEINPLEVKNNTFAIKVNRKQIFTCKIKFETYKAREKND